MGNGMMEKITVLRNAMWGEKTEADLKKMMI